MRLTKKRKTKIAKVLAIVSGCIILASFVIKEIVKEELKDLHDSLARAESQFRIESGQSTIQLQLLTAQEQLENANLLADREKGKQIKDYTALITQDTMKARQALAEVNADFDTVSRLIDAFPSRAKDIREFLWPWLVTKSFKHRLGDRRTFP